MSLVQIGAVPAKGTILRRTSVYRAVILEQDLDFLSAVSRLQFIGSCSQNRGISVLVCLLQLTAPQLSLLDGCCPIPISKGVLKLETGLKYRCAATLNWENTLLFIPLA